jgi:hypothetical protein
VVPVNPSATGEILGERCYATLPEPVDVVELAIEAQAALGDVAGQDLDALGVDHGRRGAGLLGHPRLDERDDARVGIACYQGRDQPDVTSFPPCASPASCRLQPRSSSLSTWARASWQ